MINVLGMHRSGSSVASRALACLGAEHSEHLLGGNAGNGKGHFEDSDILNFNEHKLCPALGVDWDSLSDPDWTRLSGNQLSKLASQALDIVRRNFGHIPLSILKEPRIGITLKFWLSIFARAGIAVKHVCVVRDPLSVARSLQSRDGFSLSKGSALYVHYWSSILNHVPSTDAAWMHYDELIEKPEQVLRNLATQLGLPVPSDFSRRLEIFLKDFIDPTLRHSSVSLPDLGLEPEIIPASIELYGHLLSRVSSQELDHLDAFVHRLFDGISSWAPLFGEYDALIRKSKNGAQNAEQERVLLLEEKGSAEATASEARRQLDEARGVIHQLTEEARRTQERHAIARGELAERVTLLTDARDELSQARDREEALAQALTQELRRALEDSHTRSRSLESQNLHLENRLQEQEREHTILENEAAYLKGCIDSQTREAERLNGLLSAQESRLGEINDTLFKNAEHQEAMAVANEQLEAALSAERSERLALSEQLNQTNSRFDEQRTFLERERDSLQAALNERCLELARLEDIMRERDDIIATQDQALAAERTEKLALSEQLAQANTQAEKQRTALERERDSLQANVDERFRELAQLAKMMLERDDKIAVQEQALAAERAEKLALSEQLTQANTQAEKQRTALERERDSLQTNVDERFRELALLAQMVMQKDVAIEDSRAAAAKMKASVSWKLTRPIRWLGDAFGESAKERKRFQRLCSIIEQSGMFDATWYKNTYPDVAQSSLNPIEHYLRHGAREGRNPSPRFNTQNYLHRYPDVANETPPINPLLHYVLHGKKEGRSA